MTAELTGVTGTTTHKRLLENGEAYPACRVGFMADRQAVLADGWAAVSCERCLLCRPDDTLKESVRSFCSSVGLLASCVLLVALSAGVNNLILMLVFGLGAAASVIYSVGSFIDGCRLLRDWWRGVEEPRLVRYSKANGRRVGVAPGRCVGSSLDACWNRTRSGSLICDECEKKHEPKHQPPPEPRWAHLLDRDDVLVLDTQTNGLDADAEVTDVAVINTRGRVLIDDLRRAGATSYRDIHDRLMRVLDRASTVCVYNAGYDMQMIEQSAARHGLDVNIRADVVCIMEEYANLYTNDGRWPKLDKAAAAEGVSVGGARHRPLTDARLTLSLICAVVERERAQAKRERTESVELTEDDIPF